MMTIIKLLGMKILLINIYFFITTLAMAQTKMDISLIKRLRPKEVTDLLKSSPVEDYDILNLQIKYGLLQNVNYSSFRYYELPDRTFLLVDKSNGSGLHYPSKKFVYDYFILPDKIWAGIETENIWSNFTDPFPYIFLVSQKKHAEVLSKIFKMDIASLNFTEKSLLSMQGMINSGSIDRNELKKVFPTFYFYVGEVFRQKIKGKWHFTQSRFFKNQMNLFIGSRKQIEYYLWIPLWEQINSEEKVDLIALVDKDNPYFH